MAKRLYLSSSFVLCLFDRIKNCTVVSFASRLIFLPKDKAAGENPFRSGPSLSFMQGAHNEVANTMYHNDAKHV